MVMLKYHGLNTFSIGGYQKIASYKFLPKKCLEMLDEDFYRLMQVKGFAYRVKNKIIEVPKDFHLEKEVESIDEKEKTQDEIKEESAIPSLKEVLRAIEQTDDIQLLYDTLEHDKRTKVYDACIKRIQALEG